MNYFVKRGEQEYGPYSLAALQQYVSQGNIASNDMARSEGMTEWMPVSSILGNVPVAAPPSPFGAVVPATPTFPAPPGLHWAIVLALSVVTVGIFAIIWAFVQAAWVRKVWPTSKALWYYVAYLAIAFGGALYFGEAGGPGVRIAATVVFLMGTFVMRRDIMDFYETVNPIGLELGAVMTFFFGVFYFQYHFREIRELQMHPLASSAAASSN